MNFSKFGIVYGLIALVAVLFVLTRLFPNVTLQELSQRQFTGRGVTLSPSPVTGISVDIDYGNSKKSYQNLAASNAYLALVEAAKQDNVPVSVKQYDFGILVDKVGELQSNQDRTWVYYVNGQSGDVAADKKEIKPGDKVEWKYAKP